jgi:hypothetical protein
MQRIVGPVAHHHRQTKALETSCWTLLRAPRPALSAFHQSVSCSGRRGPERERTPSVAQVEVPPAGTRRKGRSQPGAFVQVDATYSLAPDVIRGDRNADSTIPSHGSTWHRRSRLRADLNDPREPGVGLMIVGVPESWIDL